MSPAMDEHRRYCEQFAHLLTKESFASSEWETIGSVSDGSPVKRHKKWGIAVWHDDVGPISPLSHNVRRWAEKLRQLHRGT